MKVGSEMDLINMELLTKCFSNSLELGFTINAWFDNGTSVFEFSDKWQAQGTDAKFSTELSGTVIISVQHATCAIASFAMHLLDMPKGKFKIRMGSSKLSEIVFCVFCIIIL